jgi:acetyl esterase/lipase
MNKKIKFTALLSALSLSFILTTTGCSASKNNESATSTASAAADLTNMPPTYKDVVFATVNKDNGEKKDLKMNIFLPKSINKPVPVVVYIHGGAWYRGDYQGSDAPKDTNSKDVKTTDGDNSNQNDIKKQVVSESSYGLFKKVLNNGIAFVSIDYRLSTEATFPAQIYDVKGSIRYLRAHASEYGIDPDKIAVAGSSAGGHLTAELATTGDVKELEGDVGGNLNYSSKVIAAVDYYGPTDLLTMGPEMDPTIQSPADAAENHDSPRAAESKLLGFDKDGQGIGVLRNLRDKNQTDSPYWDKVKLAQMASPINYVSSDDPPMFIAHGASDNVVPIQQSLRFRDALNHAGVENIFMSYSKDHHGNQCDDINNAAIIWITNKLLGKQ